METPQLVHINLKREADDSYDIVIGENLFPQVAEYLVGRHKADRIALITDSNLLKAGQAEALTRALGDKGLSCSLHSFPGGEKSKTLDTCTGLLDGLLDAGYGRDTVILALGGGVVGDMAGLVAGLHNRGVPYIQVPTTTVSQADSSVGGKTGVDTRHGKNLVGLFKQPERVFIDVKTLLTLPEKEYVSGLAETVKHGVVLDEAFFAFLEANAEKLGKRDPATLCHAARENCRIKGYVVERDPLEKGLRRIVNYGHTLGHALEREMDFSMLHGEAISIGMMVAGKIAEIQYGFKGLARQETLLKALGLPTKLPSSVDNVKLLAASTMDKKAVKNRARYSLPERIGKMFEFGGAYVTEVKEEVILQALDATR